MSLAINSQMPSNVGDGAASPTSPRTTAFTNTAGTILYVWVGAATDPSSGAAVALTSVTYGGTAMTLVASQASDTANNRGKLFLYRLLNPATGSNNIVVTWSGTFKDIEVGAISFTGNNTTTPEKQSVVNHGSGTSATAALSGVTSGNISIAAAGAGSAFSAQSQTLDWAKNVDNNTYMGNARASTSTASGAVTHGFTLASDSWAAIAVEVAAASGGTTYNDSASGTITLSGSDGEAASFASVQSGSILLSGSESESVSHSASGTGTVSLSGAAVEGASFADSGSGFVTLSGSAVDQWGRIFIDSGSGTISLSGSGADAYTISGSATGTIELTGVATEQFIPGGIWATPSIPRSVVLPYTDGTDLWPWSWAEWTYPGDFTFPQSPAPKLSASVPGSIFMSASTPGSTTLPYTTGTDIFPSSPQDPGGPLGTFPGDFTFPDEAPVLTPSITS